MQKMRKGVIVGLLAITALAGNISTVYAQPFEMKKEVKYSIQHSDITETGIRKEDIDEIVNKLPNLESERKIEILIEQEEKAKLSNEDIAKMVINGEYGNGEERKQRLEEEGRNVGEIQKEVEKILNVKKEQEGKIERQAKSNKSPDRGSVKSGTQNQSKPASQPKPAVTNQSLGKTMTMEATAYSTAQPGLRITPFIELTHVDLQLCINSSSLRQLTILSEQ